MRWILVVALWLTGWSLAYLTFQERDGGDLRAYRVAAENIHDGDPIYEDYVAMQPQIYLYPPLTAMLLVPPVAILNYDQIKPLWFGFNALITVGIMVALQPYVPTRYRLLFWVAPVFWMPFFTTYRAGQVEMVVMGCLVGTWIFTRRGKPVRAGGLLALAAWIKVWPAVIILYFVFKRSGRTLIGLAVTGIALGAIQLIAVGPGQFFFYFTDVLPDLSGDAQLTIMSSNQSAYGFAAKMFSKVPYVQPVLESGLLLRLVHGGLTLALMGSLLWVSVRSGTIQPDKHRTFDLEFALAILVATMLRSSLNYYGTLPVYFVFVLLIRSVARVEQRRIGWLIVTVFFLVNHHFFLVQGGAVDFSDKANGYPAPFLSLPFYGMLLLWVVTLAYLTGSTSELPRHESQPGHS